MKKNKLVVGSAFAFMTIFSLFLGWILANNMSKDTSKLRTTLTKEYKELKDIKYEYNSEIGKKVFISRCSSCHGINGQGSMAVPPLANNDIILNNTNRTIKVVINGLQGSIERLGKRYNSIMPGYYKLPHSDLAHALNYVRNSWGNKADEITTIDIINSKVQTIDKKGAWRAEDFNN